MSSAEQAPSCTTSAADVNKTTASITGVTEKITSGLALSTIVEVKDSEIEKEEPQLLPEAPEIGTANLSSTSPDGYNLSCSGDSFSSGLSTERVETSYQEKFSSPRIGSPDVIDWGAVEAVFEYPANKDEQEVDKSFTGSVSTKDPTLEHRGSVTRQLSDRSNASTISASTMMTRKRKRRPLPVRATKPILLRFLLRDPQPDIFYWRAFLLSFRDYTSFHEILKLIRGSLLESKGDFYTKSVGKDRVALIRIKPSVGDKNNCFRCTESKSGQGSSFEGVCEFLNLDMNFQENVDICNENAGLFLRMTLDCQSMQSLQREELFEIVLLCKQIGDVGDIMQEVCVVMERRGETFQNFSSTRKSESENESKHSDETTETTAMEKDSLKKEDTRGIMEMKSDSSILSVESPRGARQYRTSLPSSSALKRNLSSSLDVDNTPDPKSVSSNNDRRRRTSSGSWMLKLREKSSGRFRKQVGPFNGYRPKQVADALTAMLCDQCYYDITPESLLTEKSRKNSESVQRMISLFNAYSWWCATWVLTGFEKKIAKKFKGDVDDHISRVKYMLSVAEECRKLRNFHTFFGIMGGLLQPHLSWVWDLAKEKEKQKFDDLKRAISSKGDYRVYRADLSKSKGKSCIPYLGVTTKGLYLLEKEVKIFSKQNRNLVNFGRSVTILSSVDEFLNGQETPYLRYKVNIFFRTSTSHEQSTPLKVHPKLFRTLEKQMGSAKTWPELEEISQKKKQQMQSQVWDAFKSVGFL